MIAIPAVDLREGACVQLVGGAYEAERIRLENPVQVALSWVKLGFQRLHVVDLDAATGRGSNRPVVLALLRQCPVPVQVGGGVRSEEDIQSLLDDGASWVVVGTRALEDAVWLRESAVRHPGKLIVAADVRERTVVSRGWQKMLDRDIRDVIGELNPLPLGGVLVTAVHREGQLLGADLPLMQELGMLSKVPLLASGGIATLDDLRALAQRRVEGAILGMAIYTGAIDPQQLAAEFGASVS